MELERALADGQSYLKNAEDELDRKILREEQLYFIDNQVEAIDTFLADTEESASQAPALAELRTALREMKNKLERKSMEWLAKEDGAELPDDLPPEETAAAMLDAGAEFLQMADEVLGVKVKKLDQIANLEDPLITINSFLADSEPYVTANPKLGKAREELKLRKVEIQKRIREVLSSWRSSDLGSGDEDDE